MKKVLLVFFLLLSVVFAKKEDYSEMSTQELIEIIGYVKDQNKESFLKELNSRIPKMNEQEKLQYNRRINQEILEEKIEDEE
ncbi:DUF1104 domain-containing protein [Arcobacter cloacae]|uniref:DUF1104 domain-containing protein n=1 Tax=Arcobacter cloacae TaxID=1054034 RepID=A0A6M8NNN9_9BACT|nr:DUF1104 domain-containing protein [Arcobacter cloacae]QKF90007.1 hypothetical protein ACLO_1516 [Arcobacter cloacae]RXI37193.1 DUF1104 domain-containing protein [Arcobacter cloacae]